MVKLREFLPVLMTRRKFSNYVDEAIRKAVANVEREYRSVIDEIQKGINTSVVTDDLFYSALTESIAYEQINKRKIMASDRKKLAIKMVSEGNAFNFTEIASTEQSDAERRAIQELAYNKAFTDPIVGAIPDTYERFVLGRGIKFRCEVPAVQEVLEKFWRDNDMENFSRQRIWLLVVESELFILYYLGNDGTVLVREIPPAEITEIETDPDDKATILAYHRSFVTSTNVANIEDRYYPDIEYYNYKNNPLIGITSQWEGEKGWQGPNKLVQYVKFMPNREVRSRIFLERVLKWANLFKQWLYDRAIINHEKGRVVWILTISTRKSDAWERYKPAPAGGTIKISTPDRKWEVVNAKIGADDAKEDGMFLIYQITAGSGIPMHVLTQRADAAVYASLRKMDTPFSQNILAVQDFVSDNLFKKMFKVVIRANVEAGNLPEKVIVKKFIKEHLVYKHRCLYESYRNDKITYKEYLDEVLKILTTVINSDDYDNNLVDVKFVTECMQLRTDCQQEMVEVLESNKSENKEFLNRIVKIFETGVDIEVETENVPIQIVFPDVVRENVAEMAKVLQIHDAMKIASKTTLAAKAGYDPEQEIYLKRRDKLFTNPQDISDDKSKSKEE